MGKRDDWCSSKGWKYRAKGMYNNEKKTAKFCYLAIFTVGMIAYLLLGIVHIERSVNATMINVDHRALTLGMAYDSCALPGYQVDSTIDTNQMSRLDMNIINRCGQDIRCYEQGTQWSSVWNFNSWILMVQVANYILLMFGSFWFWPRCIGTCCNCCCGCCHLLAILSIFGARYSPFGEKCSYNVMTSTYEGNFVWDTEGATYQDDAAKLSTLAVIQTIFWCIQCSVCYVPLFRTPVGDKKEKIKYNQQAQAPIVLYNVGMNGQQMQVAQGIPVETQNHMIQQQSPIGGQYIEGVGQPAMALPQMNSQYPQINSSRALQIEQSDNMKR